VAYLEEVFVILGSLAFRRRNDVLIIVDCCGNLRAGKSAVRCCDFLAISEL